ncbi:MAG TPA: hypothetical protein ENN80_00345, partial [Candidatus Hydrogenedentes bacterium]|nr:hypothetical protein [Candidatus Hydrogenedentota bacterium]
SIHPASKVIAEMPESIRSWKGVPQAYHYEHPDYPDVKFEGIFLPSSLGSAAIPFLGRDLSEWMGMYDRLATFGFMVSDSSYGRVIRVPGLRHLVRYQLTDHDLDGFYFAIKLIARCFFAVGARRIILPVANEGNVYTTGEELEQRFRREDLQPSLVYAMAFHPLGTCRFSGTPENGVVDRLGRCHYHDNLYILDGASIPGPLGVNPQVTIMTFSRLAARELAK